MKCGQIEVFQYTTTSEYMIVGVDYVALKLGKSFGIALYSIYCVRPSMECLQPITESTLKDNRQLAAMILVSSALIHWRFIGVLQHVWCVSRLILKLGLALPQW